MLALRALSRIGSQNICRAITNELLQNYCISSLRLPCQTTSAAAQFVNSLDFITKHCHSQHVTAKARFSTDSNGSNSDGLDEQSQHSTTGRPIVNPEETDQQKQPAKKDELDQFFEDLLSDMGEPDPEEPQDAEDSRARVSPLKFETNTENTDKTVTEAAGAVPKRPTRRIAVQSEEDLSYKGELYAYDYEQLEEKRKAMEKSKGAEEVEPDDDLHDELFELVKNASKKKQRHMLRQMLSSNSAAEELMEQMEKKAEEMRSETGRVEEDEKDWKRDDKQQEYIQDNPKFIDYDVKLVDLRRTCTGTPSGGKWRYSAMVVVGNGQGVLGHGSGKGADSLSAVTKAHLRALDNLVGIHRHREHTVFHEKTVTYGKVKVIVYPRSEGSGTVASPMMRDILKLGGLHDVGVKVYGSRNARNSVKGLFLALTGIRDIRERAREKGQYAVERAVGRYHLPI